MAMNAKAENQKKVRKTPKNPAKRLAILKAAESTFARKGFHEATISDVAKKARVSEATIYEYFTSKEELLFSIPSETIYQHQQKNRELLEYIDGSANKLKMLIYRHLKLYADNPDYANVAMLILKTNRNFLKTEEYKVIQAAARITRQVLEEGIENGEFHSDIQPTLVRAMIWGTIEHLTIRKSLLGKPEDLLALANKFINTLFKGILAPQEENIVNVHVTVEHKDNKET